MYIWQAQLHQRRALCKIDEVNLDTESVLYGTIPSLRAETMTHLNSFDCLVMLGMYVWNGGVQRW